MKINGIDQKYPKTERRSKDLWMDSKGKEVQSQIANTKNRLKELSADQGLNEEEKEKQRKELQQKLADLNKQLRKRQLELQQKMQEQKQTAYHPTKEKTDVLDAKSNNDKADTTGFPQTGTKAIIAANSAIHHAKSHETLAAELKSQVRILQGEIKQDQERGKDTSHKQKELQKLEDKAAKLNGAGFGLLADASKEMRQAAQKEKHPNKKIGKQPDGFVRPLKSPLSSKPKSKTDIYIKGDMFSNVDFHF